MFSGEAKHGIMNTVEEKYLSDSSFNSTSGSADCNNYQNGKMPYFEVTFLRLTTFRICQVDYPNDRWDRLLLNMAWHVAKYAQND